MKFQKQLIILMVTMLTITGFSPGLTALAQEVAPDEDYISDEYVVEDYGIDLSEVDMTEYDPEGFASEYDFLAQDSTFLELENELSVPRIETTYEKHPFTGELIAKQEVLPAVVLGALRVLFSKVGKTAATRAWNIAKPQVQKALNAPSKYYLDGPNGGRIIQVRLKSTKQPVFRLDFHYIDGKGPYLHYHIAPNMKKHHYL